MSFINFPSPIASALDSAFASQAGLSHELTTASSVCSIQSTEASLTLLDIGVEFRIALGLKSTCCA